MGDALLSPFDSPSRHEAVSEIIRHRSTNRIDVRDAALSGLDLSLVRTILDLGCGFGFMTEAVAQRVAPEARFVGVDACASNEQPYLERVARTGHTGQFIGQRIDTGLDWPDGSFDLVVASYSLYFFPQVLPAVARVLASHGMFVAVTHTESSYRHLLRVLALPESGSPLLAAMRGFSAENGRALLTPWFGQVECVDYQNAVVFDTSEPEDFLTYLRFKLPVLWPGLPPDGELPEPLVRAARAALSRAGRLVLEKNDAAFHCRRPRCP